MSTTYDPFDPAYFDEDDLREELTRVYDLCHGCRLCFKFCTAFPTLFQLIDRHDDQDAARLTTGEQDQVVDECFNCKLCYVNCPYVPGQHEWALDFPRLMLRAEAVRHRNGAFPLRHKVTSQFLGRTDLVGKLGTATAPVANRALARPGSAVRKVMEKVTGVAAERVLPPYARQRFSTWFRKRAPFRGTRGTVAVFPTCMVEYQDAQVGKDLVRVYERNGVGCSVPEGVGCCGAPWLHSGDVESFRKQAGKNLPLLAGAVRAGNDVVVAEPTCGYVLKFDYKDYVGGDDAELVASHTYDAAEYLWTKVHKAEDGGGLDTEFTGPVPEGVTYHAPCHLRAQNVGLKSRDVLKLTGTKVTVVAECSGIDGTWGLRKENYETARGVARKMAAGIERAGNDVVAGDCTLANGGIVLETGITPVHPLSFLARAYGIPEQG